LNLAVALLSFSLAAINISEFIESQTLSFFMKFTIPSLCAVAFVISYFIVTLLWPRGEYKPTCFGSVAFSIWSLLIIVFMFLTAYLAYDHPVRQLSQAAVSYNFAGMMIAFASNRINAMKKI
jgi:hypothetical protein